MKIVKRLMPKKVVDYLSKVGPMKCAVAGVFFYLAEKALATKALSDFHQGDSLECLIYGGAAAVSLLAASTFLIVGDGYVPIHNYYKKKKKERRARRLYNAWKTCPSMAYSAINA